MRVVEVESRAYSDGTVATGRSPLPVQSPAQQTDVMALIARARQQLLAWHAKYGEHQPQWLPPAGDVRWLEDAAAFLAVHQWQQPAFVAGPGCPVSGVSTWRTGRSGALVRVCEASDVECSRGCNVGPCVKRAADLAGVEGARHQTFRTDTPTGERAKD